MPSSTIDGQYRIDWIRHNLLSTVAAVSGWKQFLLSGLLNSSNVCLKHHESWSAALIRGKATTQILKVICQPSFPSNPPRWAVEFAEWWFRMSGFRVDGGQWARWDALWEKERSIWTTHDPLGSSHRKPQSWNRTQSYCMSRWTVFLSLICSARCLLICFFPLEFRLCTDRADAMTFWSLRLLGSAGIHIEWPQEWRAQLEEYLPSECLWTF